MPEHETQATALLPLDAETQKQLSLHGLEVNSDGYIDWAKNSPSHPRNWSVCRKAYDIGLIIFLDFFTTGISAGGTPASTFALDDFHIGSTLGIFAFASIYLVGQGLGGLLFSPYSETFGRRALYMWSALFYSLFCILVAAAPNIGAVFAGRFITGFLSAIPSVIVSGSIEDLFDTEAQIWMFFAWSVIVNLSLVLGPLLAFYIANALNWTWIFYISAIALLVTTLALLLIRESRPSHSLTKRVSALRKAHPEISLPTPPSSATPSLRHFITMSLIRPPLLFFTDPIVAITSVLSAVVFALIYLLTAALPLIYSSFGLSPKNSMLILLFVGVGLVSSAGTRFYDRHVARTYRRLSRPLTPEAKLTGFVIAAPVLAGSLWIFAWTIPPLVHSAPWIISALALIPLGYATNEFDTVLAGYLADSYTAYVASAFTSLAFLRAFLSAAFPLFTEQLFGGLGNNFAGSILAGIATLFCIVPVLLVKYGKELRGRSRFARESMGGGSGEGEGEGEGNGRGELVQMLERERRARGRGGRRRELPRLPTYKTF